jgi:hypothetical protein
VTGRRNARTDATTERVAGLLFIAIGTYLIYCGYDKRGVPQPFWTRFIPGV